MHILPLLPLLCLNNEYNQVLFCESHFLVIPTRADCTPVVFPEACSFGLPCITTNVGGIATVIKDGVNGRMFSKGADVSEYCKYIYGVFNDRSAYEQLAFSAFNEYQRRLNWSAAGARVKELMMEILRK